MLGRAIAFCVEGEVVVLAGTYLERTIAIIQVIIGVVPSNINAIGIDIPSTRTTLRGAPSDVAITGSCQISVVVSNIVLSIASIGDQSDLWDGAPLAYRETVFRLGNVDRGGGHRR